MSASENFDISIAEDAGDTAVITGGEKVKLWVEQALAEYDPSNEKYSAYLSDRSTTPKVTFDIIRNLAETPQSDLSKILQINSIVRFFINIDDLFGKTYESLETNVNTRLKLEYNKFPEQRNKLKQLTRAKDIIDNFNRQINLEVMLRSVIPMTFAEGNYVMCLRGEKDSYAADYYPLGVVIVSDYDMGGKPQILIDMAELKSRLQKTYLKTRKNKAVFMKNLEEDIKSNYPEEVYEAYKNNEKYARLKQGYCGIIRIQNMGRKYGLTPFFRALEPLLRLRNLYNADDLNNKAKAKKIICQIMRKELLGENAENDGIQAMVYAHRNFMSAWKQTTVVVTTPPSVERVEYIEPKVEDINSDKFNLYRSIVMTTLGIGYLNSESRQAFTVATISINQLMAVINKISEQFEKILEGWYRIVLADNGIPAEFAPKVSIIDAEQTDISIRQSLVELLYGKLNCSMRTAYETLGYSIEDEKQRRIEENEAGYDSIFTPHDSIYTKSSDSGESGRPLDENPANGDKQDYDRDYRKENKI